MNPHYERQELLTDYQLLSDYLKRCYEAFDRMGWTPNTQDEVGATLGRMGEIVKAVTAKQA